MVRPTTGMLDGSESGLQVGALGVPSLTFWPFCVAEALLAPTGVVSSSTPLALALAFGVESREA